MRADGRQRELQASWNSYVPDTDPTHAYVDAGPCLHGLEITFIIHRGGEGNGTPLQYSCLEKSHGQRSLEGCSPWGLWGSDTTEQLHFDFSLSCIGEGNGNPLQCSCLENPRNKGARWAAVYGVAQSRTQLKWLSSSSSIHRGNWGWVNEVIFLS